MTIRKPEGHDLVKIKEILNQWTDPTEVDKYCKRVINEIRGTTEYNLQFWVIEDVGLVSGIIAICDPLPTLKKYFSTTTPIELKILYIDNQCQGKGLGTALVKYAEQQALQQGFSQMLVRSAERYRETALGFYERLSYQPIGTAENEEGQKMQVFTKILGS